MINSVTNTLPNTAINNPKATPKVETVEDKAQLAEQAKTAAAKDTVTLSDNAMSVLATDQNGTRPK